MRVNPRIEKFDDCYAVSFIRSNGKRLFWIQDLTARKMKVEELNRPIVLFSTPAEAEAETQNLIIPYLIKEKDVPPEDIIGW